jgi:alkylated DNA repair protein (DNA oxidative demethylase)
MSVNLFEIANDGTKHKEELGPGAVVLRGFALSDEAALLAALNDVIAQAPFRHRITPGGYRHDMWDDNKCWHIALPHRAW